MRPEDARAGVLDGRYTEADIARFQRQRLEMLPLLIDVICHPQMVLREYGLHNGQNRNLYTTHVKVYPKKQEGVTAVFFNLDGDGNFKGPTSFHPGKPGPNALKKFGLMVLDNPDHETEQMRSNGLTDQSPKVESENSDSQTILKEGQYSETNSSLKSPQLSHTSEAKVNNNSVAEEMRSTLKNTVHPNGGRVPVMDSPAAEKGRVPLTLHHVVGIYRTLAGRYPKVVKDASRSPRGALGWFRRNTQDIAVRAQLFGLADAIDIQALRIPFVITFGT